MCIPCEKNAEKFYKALSEENGKTYLRYKEGNNVLIIEKNDFETAIQIGQIPANTESEVLF